MADLKLVKKDPLPGSTPQEWERLGLAAIDRIKYSVTREGSDAQGSPLKPYKPSYLPKKQKTNPGWSGRVDLTVTGDMFANFKVKLATVGRTVIGWSGLEALKAIGNDALRSFAILSSATISALVAKAFKK